MKRITLIIFLSGISNLVCHSQTNDGVGIGTTSVNSDAIFEVESDNKGVLIPRLSTSQRNALPAVSEGLIIFDSDINAFYYYDGSSWIRLIASPTKANIDLNNYKITNLSNGTSSKDAVNKGQLDLKLSRSGGSMTGSVAMGNNKVTGLGAGTSSTDAVNKSQLDTKANKSQQAWTNFVLINGWVAGTNGRGPQYRKDEFGRVFLRGHLDSSGSTSSVISTSLPSSYLPARSATAGTENVYYLCATQPGRDSDYVIVTMNSAVSQLIVSLNYSTQNDFCLDGISWDTEDY